jgi:mRNA-degrading endonuclease RelE of RelBE toxin-antitoxin system
MDDIEKLLSKVPGKHRDQILLALACLYDEQCRAKLRIEKLKGHADRFRIRSGRYRIIFEMNITGIALRDIRLRNEKTYRDY